MENNWTFTCKRRCPDMPSRKMPSQERRQIFLECEDYTLREARDSVYEVPSYHFDNDCIDHVILRNCRDGKLVPNIIHYVWFGKREMNFYHFLAVMGVHKKQKPCLILFHSDYLPFGPYWEYLLELVPNIIHVQFKPDTVIAGKRIKFVEHQADYARLKAIQRFGGIYADTDTIFLRSLDPLRNYNFTLSKAFDYNLSNGLILSACNATFLKYWFKAYETYDPNKWGYHSTIIPFKIWQSHLDEVGLIHVEEKTFVKPNGIDAPKQIFKENYNWSHNYAIHMFIRFNRTVHNFKDIRYLNTTVGSVSRFILLDNKELCEN
ncbi:hypothetical protein FSP39_007237 [Pinctada imbricata]|uniref:Alpha-1,4-N-acetylglucosaminyltransferase n=1 Tax=Pinctada imbricata TaxID=66713 RepID=A0AA88YDY9_PINIB|nr:hypothetical protein FSP39_007237 [Pinctada imbricata]